MYHNRAISIIPLFIILNLLAIAAISQEYIINGYSVSHFNDESGLPQNSVKDICSGNNGQLWLSTEAGLVEYDGSHFINYDKDILQTNNSRIFAMGHMVFNNTSFALTQDKEYIELNGDKPLYNKVASELISKTFQFQLPFKPHDYDDTGGFINQQLEYMPVWENTHRKTLLVLGFKLGFYYFIKNDSLFYANYDHVIWKQKVTAKFKFAVHKEYFIVWDFSDTLLLFDENGYKKEIILHNIDNIFWNRAEQQFFVLTKKGELFYLNEERNLELLIEAVPPEFEIVCSYYLKELGILFMGSLTDGLLVCRKQHFRTNTHKSMPGYVFYSLLNYGDTCVLTHNGYIIGQGGSVKIFNDSLANKRPYYMSRALQNASGEYFFSAFHRLTLYGSKGEIKKSLPYNLDVTMAFADEDGILWLGFENNTFQKFDGKKLTFLRKNIPIVYCFLGLSKRYLLLGTDNGLYWYDKKNDLMGVVAGTEKMTIRSITLSSSKHLYISTVDFGIALVEPSGIKKLPLDQNGYLKTAHCILEDSKNRFWITCNKGLYCIPEKSLLAQKNNKDGFIYHHYFGRANGFVTNEFNGGCYPCGIKMRSGEFVFPSLKGLVWFHPDSIQFLHSMNKLKTRKILIDDTQLLDIDDTMAINPAFKRLEIMMSLPYYGERENIFVEYKIEGTQSWIKSDIDFPLVFTSLKPGYTNIKFRAKNGFGENDYTYLNITFYRRPKLWEYKLFYPFLFMLIVFIGYILYRLRTASLKKRNLQLQNAITDAKKTITQSYHQLEETTEQLKRKTRFHQWLITSIVHDLRGPLRFVTQYSSLYKREEQPTRNEIDFLRSVVDTNKDIYSYSEQLLQMIKLQESQELLPEKVDFQKIAISRINLFKKEAEFKNIEIKLELIGDKHVYINPAALAIVLQNLMDNSIKIQMDGELKILFINTGKEFSVEINDQGPGMPKHLLEIFNEKNIQETEEYPDGIGLGIWLILSTVKKTGGEIEFKNKNVGLCVKVKWKQ